MKIKNKLTPYPILSPYNNDYIDSSFETIISADCIFSEILINVEVNLVNDGLKELIDNELAGYIMHIECPSTSYRGKFDINEYTKTIKLDSSNLKDKIEICTYIIAKQHISSYKNKNFHDDYKEYKFNILKGNILAIGNGKEFIIEKNNDDLEDLPSIIKICKKTELKNGTVSVDTDNSNYILVGVHEGIYDLYYSLGKNRYKDTVFSIILLPALIIVLTKMKFADEDDKDKKWFRVIEELLENNNISVDELDLQNKEKSVLNVAQMIFKDPIKRSLQELENNQIWR